MPLIKLSANQWVNLEQIAALSDSTGTSTLTVHLVSGVSLTLTGNERANLLTAISSTGQQGPPGYVPRRSDDGAELTKRHTG